jgi:spore coat protein U-like protein
MTRTFKSLAMAAVAAALFASGSIAQAATNQAVLTVNATVTNNCDVLTQPSTLTMSYNPVLRTGTLGTSSFTYACTSGTAVSVTPTSPNGPPNVAWWVAVGPNMTTQYGLSNDLTCRTNQLTNGTSESLSTGTGSSQTYNICALTSQGSNQSLTAGIYVDTVTFTFNFGP